MSAASLSFVSSSKSLDPRCHLSIRSRNTISFSGNGIPTWTRSALRPPPSFSALFFRLSNGSSKRSISSIFTGVQSISPVMQLQDCTVKMVVDVPLSVAYSCYSDREAITRWMPFISSVKILEAKPELSRWSLKYNVLGRDVEFSWIALNMQPIPNQKIHWRSMEGLRNKHFDHFLRACLEAVLKAFLHLLRLTDQNQPCEEDLKPIFLFSTWFRFGYSFKIGFYFDKN